MTPLNKKRFDFVETYRPAMVQPSVSKNFERIIQKQFSVYIGDFLSPYFSGYWKDFNT